MQSRNWSILQMRDRSKIDLPWLITCNRFLDRSFSFYNDQWLIFTKISVFFTHLTLITLILLFFCCNRNLFLYFRNPKCFFIVVKKISFIHRHDRSIWTNLIDQNYRIWSIKISSVLIEANILWSIHWLTQSMIDLTRFD